MVTSSPEGKPDPDRASTGELLELVYTELRAVAARRLAAEAPGQTLQATALVHEVWMKLGAGEGPQWNDRAHFYAAAVQAMRRILIDQARRKQAVRHGGGWLRVDPPEFDDFPLPHPDADADERLERLDSAIEALAAGHPDKAALVRLRFYTGLTIEAAAAVLGISPASAKRHWAFARAWLFRELTRGARTR